MNDTDLAATLRRAASEIHYLAVAKDETSPGDWQVTEHNEQVDLITVDADTAFGVANDLTDSDARYIAMMYPPVGADIARLLERAASDIDIMVDTGADSTTIEHSFSEALSVARRILRFAPEKP